jgi:hypothetical protein
MNEIINQFKNIRAFQDELEKLKEGYDILELLYISMDSYHPTIDGKEIDRDLINRMQRLFKFDDSE